MTIVFTDEELKWINKEKFKWSIKNECPNNLRKKINEKLNVLYDFEKRINSKEELLS